MKKYVKIVLLTLSILTVRLQNYAQSVSNTGQTSIAVPIHTVQDGSAVVPIALSYDHSGVKPDVHPGWVGQNWNLAAGGMITRVVRDIPDDFDADVYIPSSEPFGNWEVSFPFLFRLFAPLQRRMMGLAIDTTGFGTDNLPKLSTAYATLNATGLFPQLAPPSIDLNYFAGPENVLLSRDCNLRYRPEFGPNNKCIYRNRDIFFNTTVDWDKKVKFDFMLGTGKVTYSSNGTIGNFYDKGGVAQFKIADSEPDIFNFTLPNGLNGTFFFDIYSKQWTVRGNKTLKIKENFIGRIKPPFKDPNPVTTSVNYQGSGVLNGAKIEIDDVRRTIFGTGDGRSTQFMTTEYTKTFSGFEITTDDGTKYIFGGDTTSISYSMSFNYQAHSHWIADTWHLKGIVTPDNHQVYFVYETAKEKLPNGKEVGSQFISSMYMSAGSKKYTDYEKDKTARRELVPTIDYSNGVFSGQLQRPVYLSKIVSNLDSIVFKRSRSVELEYPEYVYKKSLDFWNTNTQQGSGYVDGGILPGIHDPWSPLTFDATVCNKCLANETLDQYVTKLNWAKLDTVEVYNKTLTGKNKVATFVLNYNNSGQNYTYTDLGSGKYKRVGSFNQRKRLLGMQRIAPNVASLITSFEYNDNVSLPSNYLDTLGLVDHWGFYNGKKFNVAKQTSIYDYRNKNYYNFREPTTNVDTAKAGILKNIILPTCGKIEYTFEQHDYANKYNRDSCYMVGSVKVCRDKNSVTTNTTAKAGGLRVLSVKTFDAGGTTPISQKTVSYKKDYGKVVPYVSSGILDNRIEYFYNSRDGELDGDATVYPFRYAEYLRDTDCSLYPNPKLQDLNSGNITGATVQFYANNMGNGYPVSYNEITEVNADNGYNVNKFTNFYSVEGGRHYDEYLSGTQRWTTGYRILEPFTDKSFERGLVVSMELYKSDNTPISKSFNTYKELTDTLFFGKKGERFVKAMGTSSDYIFTVNDATTFSKIGNFIVNAAVKVAVDAGFKYITGGTIPWSPSTLLPEVKVFDGELYCDYYLLSAYPYKQYTYNYGIVKQINIAYNPNDQTKFVTDSIYYTYNRYYQPSEIRKRLSDGNVLITKMKYASDYADGVVPKKWNNLTFNAKANDLGEYLKYLVCNNQAGCNYLPTYQTQIWPKPEMEALICFGAMNKLSMPVEVQYLRNNKTIGGSLNFYRHQYVGTFGASSFVEIDALEKTFKMKVTPTLAAVTQSSINKTNWTFIYDATRYTIKTLQVETGTTPFSTTTGHPFIGYDKFGNLLSVTDRSGLNTKMTYDTKNQMTSRYIAGTQGEEAITKTQYVTTPLIGVKEMTDPNGKKIRYEYDGFNRLKAIKQVYSDGKEYLLKTYAYHYCNDGTTGAVSVGNFVMGTCNGSINPVGCKLSATVIPTSAIEKGQPVTIVASYDEGVGSTSSSGGVSYLWQLPDGTTQTNSTLTQATPILGDYILTVEKGQCKVCLRFTVATTSLSLVEEN